MRQFFALAVAPQYRARSYAGSPPGLHIRGGISDQQAISPVDTEHFKRSQDHIRFGLGREPIGALDMIKVRKQFELFQHRPSSRGALRCCS